MLRPERQQHRVVGRRCLELEVELAAEALAQRQTPGFVDAAAERCVQDELHAAGLVEETFEHQRALRRDRPEHAPSIRHEGDDLVRRVRGQPGLAGEPVPDGAEVGIVGQACVDIRLQLTDRMRQFVASRRCFAQPERDVRERARASATRTAPPATCSTRHDAFPSWNTSPIVLSMAKSSFTVPTNMSSGSATTR